MKDAHKEKNNNTAKGYGLDFLFKMLSSILRKVGKVNTNKRTKQNLVKIVREAYKL